MRTFPKRLAHNEAAEGKKRKEVSSLGILYEKKGKVAYITINRPEAYNAINFETWDALTQAWKDTRDDKDVWVIVITGAGDKAFSAGQDLKETLSTFYNEDPAKRRPIDELGSILPSKLQPIRAPWLLENWKPIIAAVNGFAGGAGLELAMACDLRIAADTAKLGLPEVQRSLIPGGGGTQRITRLVPFCKALEILMVGDFMDAQEAYRIGLVNKVVPLADLMKEAEAMANRICKNGPLAVRAAKEAAYRGVEMSLNDGLTFELKTVLRVMKSWDSNEGVMSFVQKRDPQYKAE
jgi:E-phenylitaconyl-CoA hydratase